MRKSKEEPAFLTSRQVVERTSFQPSSLQKDPKPVACFAGTNCIYLKFWACECSSLYFSSFLFPKRLLLIPWCLKVCKSFWIFNLSAWIRLSLWFVLHTDKENQVNKWIKNILLLLFIYWGTWSKAAYLYSKSIWTFAFNNWLHSIPSLWATITATKHFQ